MPPKRGRPPKVAKAAERNEEEGKSKKKRVNKKSENEIEIEEPVKKKQKLPESTNHDQDVNVNNSSTEKEKNQNSKEKNGAKKNEKVKAKITDKAPQANDKSQTSTNKAETNLDDIDYECHKENADGEKANFKICSWNVAGIRAVIKKKGIEYLVKEDADIIALQETKCNLKDIPNEAKLKGYHRYFVDSKKAGYCGLALYSKKEPIKVSNGLKNPEFDIEGRLITAEFDTFYLINVYVPNAGQKLKTLPKRLEWNQAFKKHVQELDKKKPVIICGDMNVAHHEIDLKNPKTNTKNAGFTKEERDDMTDFLESGFVDSFRLLYPDKTDAYTFWAYFNNARAKNVGWRLDYYLVSERMKNKICDIVNRDKVYGSDHCPVIFYGKL
ncbi:hypothetical protein TKK_0018034 [Trichogramma kaykai]|uniref:DNA-(apurinic or apyrimidinic site) endonuclease n=1 Tax=Trichogramma kaykai TaxID=54128 RepID=A0ABD2W0U2_9HYME